MKHLASCWDGDNAEKRLMNVLSPDMSDEQFEDYIKFAKDRGCNTWHLCLSNQGDGEKAGYCIYGRNWDWTPDSLYVAHFLKRIKRLRKEGFTLYGWLFTDQSKDYYNAARKSFGHYVRDLKKLGILIYMNILVCGLEWNEWANKEDAKLLIKNIKRYWTRRIGMHQTSGQYDLSLLAGIDLCIYQASKGKTPEQIKADITNVVKKVKKPVNAFEIDSHPNRELCIAAMSVKTCYGCGNW